MTPKGFQFNNAQIGTISTRADGGIGFRISTGEIPVENLAQFLSLKQQNVEVTIKPLEALDDEDLVEVSSEVEEFSPSQKLRRVLHVLWTQQGSKGDFRIWYADQIRKIIDRIKEKLD